MENNIYREMDDLREDVNVVGAHAAALSGLHPIQYNPYEPTTLSAAVGTYRDEYAVAVGVFHYTRENVMFNLGASLCSDGDLMGRAGVSFALGKSSDKKPRLASTMGGLQKQVLDMQAKLDSLEEKNARNEEIIKQNAEIMAQNEKLIRELTKAHPRADEAARSEELGRYAAPPRGARELKRLRCVLCAETRRAEAPASAFSFHGARL